MDMSIPAGAAVLLEFIYRTEVSKSPPDCYQAIYANKQHRLAKPLTEMTLGEVIAAQRAWSKNHGSSAAGAAHRRRFSAYSWESIMRVLRTSYTA